MIDWEKIPFEAIIDACTRGLEQMKEQEKKMTNPKTYYCAWHPEKGFDLRTICESKNACKHEAIYHITGDSVINPLKHLESQGWQVKEVVILEKEEFDKLRKEAE